MSARAGAHDGVEPPTLLSAPEVTLHGADLPPRARVVLTVVVGVDGSVSEVAIASGLGEPFDSAALEAARHFQFEPARDESGPRASRIRVAVHIHSADAEHTVLPDAAEGHPRKSAAPPATPAPTGPPATPPPAEEAPATRTVTVRGAPPPRSASETVLDKRALEAAPHRNASEQLLVVPGVFVSQHSGEGKAHQIFFRGFDAVHGQDVEIWAAGAPVNDVSNIHGQGYADLHFLIPELVQAIQSTPGNYDPRQGDFAVAGTLRFTLGYDEPGVTAKASLGSFGSRRLLMAYRPLGAPETTFGAFELASTDGFGPSRAARHGSAIGQTSFDLGKSVSARVMTSTYAGRFDSAGVVRLSDVESGAIDRFATYDGKQGGHSSRTQLVLELGNQDDADAKSEPDRWSIAPFVVWRALELRSDFTGRLTSAEGDSIQQLNEATSVGATASYRRTLRLLSARDALEAGISLRSDAIEQSQHRLSLLSDRVTDDTQRPGVDARVRASDAAGYLDATLHPFRSVTLRGGLRADALSYTARDQAGDGQGQERSSLGGQLSKRGTLDVAALPGLSALVSYGEGFRSPQARSLGNGETTPFTRVVSYEAGVRYQQGTRVQASLAVYRTELSDDLVFEHATARNELVPGTTRKGLAVSLAARPTSWFTSSTSFTYTHASFEQSGGQYRQGDLLPYVPGVVVRSDVAATPVLGRLLGQELKSHFGAGMTYLGERPLPYAERGHDAFLVDAGIELRLGPVETSLEVFNLLDAAWYDGEFVYASNFGGGASLVPIRHVTVGPPRSLVWSLTLYI